MTIIVVDDHGDWRDTIVEYIQDLGLDKAILTAGSLAELDQLMLSVTPGILVLGHLDTVHPVGTLAALPTERLEDSPTNGSNDELALRRHARTAG